MSVPPKSLYVHIPFCERKCHYCAFNSYAGAPDATIDRYVETLLLELGTLGSDLALETIYVGGGTPTALTGSQLDRLLGAIDVARSGPEPEWTVEMNPGTADRDRLAALLSSGVNRISMGVQSLDPVRLKRLGRIHTPEDVTTTVSTLHDAGFGNVNLDLIYGQPDQSLSQWLDDVSAIIALEPEHLSLYAQQYEEGTVYTRARDLGKLGECADEVVLEMFHAARDRLSEAGYELYEISNFARPGRQSRHNLNYWRNEPYYGIGAGAYACVDDERRLNEPDPTRYVDRIADEGHAVVERESLGSVETYVETLASGLRTKEGVDLDGLRARTGFDPRQLHGEHLDRLATEGLAAVHDGHLTLTLAGLWILDTVMEPFLDGLPRDTAACA
ncbi:MAG: coproporphyrinogen III oxidase [Planctomycetes bacterium]|nr:coproporphyrinogen III oxidase [Planctomycetota bacterium]